MVNLHGSGCIRSFVAAVIFVLISGCTTVVTNTWPAASVCGYPEQGTMNKDGCDSEKGVIHKNDATFGVAFSGGGTRASSASLGQLQALTDLGVMEKVTYISAVSGGAWAAVPYVFLPNEDEFTDKKFLGTYIEPRNLSDASLENAEEGSLASAIAKAKFSLFGNNLYFTALKAKGDETYASYLGNIFLRPFKLKKSFGGREYFTLSDTTRENLIAQNKKHGISLSDNDFYVVRHGRPFLIVNSTLMPFHSPDENYFLPVEITPMYVGIPVKGDLWEASLVDSPREPTYRVGGYVEPLAYDSYLVDRLGNGHLKMGHANLLHGFSLSDVLAATGAAPQQVFHRGGVLNILTTNMGFPEFVHWSAYERNKTHMAGTEFDHGDGGHLDNLGIMPLLARQVDNILVFVNAPIAFREDTREIVDDVTSLFDVGEKYSAYVKVFRKSPNNVVFNGVGEYEKLLKAFAEKKSEGGPLVYCQNYSVKENKLFNIKNKKVNGGAYEPTVCWVYLDRTDNWLKEIASNCQLTRQTKNAILLEKGDFKHFPHYWTFGNDLPKVTLIDKSEPQVRLLANLTAWTLRAASPSIAQAFRLAMPSPEKKTGVDCDDNNLPGKERFMKVISK